MRRSFPLPPASSMLLLLTACEPIEGDVAAYFALATTPPGGFAPIASAAQAGERAGRSLSLRYGRISVEDDDAVNNIGVTGDFGAGTGRLGITAGAATCNGCDPVIMLGADWTTPLLRRSTSDGSLGLGLTAAVGAGIPTADDADGFALSGSLGLPLSMIAGDPARLRVIPYITPAVGFGALTGDGGASDVRPMLGGGVGVVAAGGFGVSAGVQKVFVDGGEAVFGVALTIGGRQR
jgi:hypothetical protein